MCKIKELLERIINKDGELEIETPFTEEEYNYIFDYNINNDYILEDEYYDLYEFALYSSDIELSYGITEEVIDMGKNNQIFDSPNYYLFICSTKELNDDDGICHIDTYAITECLTKLDIDGVEMENSYSGQYNDNITSIDDVRRVLESYKFKPSEKLDSSLE